MTGLFFRQEFSRQCSVIQKSFFPFNELLSVFLRSLFQILFCSFAYSCTTNIYIPSKTSLVYLRFWYRKYDTLETSAISSMDGLNQYFHYPVGSEPQRYLTFLSLTSLQTMILRETNCLYLSLCGAH